MSLCLFSSRKLWLREKLSSSACHPWTLDCPSCNGPLSLQRPGPGAVVSAHSDLRRRFLYINKLQVQCVKTSFHSDGRVTRFPPHLGFSKTFPLITGDKRTPWVRVLPRQECSSANVELGNMFLYFNLRIWPTIIIYYRMQQNSV